MNGKEFLRKLRRYAKRNGLVVIYNPRRGKGGHGRILIGQNFTGIPALTHEIGPGLLGKMLRDLRLNKEELR